MEESPRKEYSDDEELEELQQIVSALDLELGRITHRGSEANLVGLRSEHVVVSRRLDSRTWFVHDARYGVGNSAGHYRGPPGDQVEAAHRVLQIFAIPMGEVATERVVTEQGQVARHDREKQAVHLEDITEGKGVAWLTRAVEDRPVWDSSLLLGLTAAGGIGVHATPLARASRSCRRRSSSTRRPDGNELAGP
jgi:hypothetical protein